VPILSVLEHKGILTHVEWEKKIKKNVGVA